MTETYAQTRWKLTDLFPSADSPEIENAFGELESKITEFEKYRADLGPELSNKTFMEIVYSLEGITNISNRVMGFARLRFSENTQDQEALSFISRIFKTACCFLICGGRGWRILKRKNSWPRPVITAISWRKYVTLNLTRFPSRKKK